MAVSSEKLKEGKKNSSEKHNRIPSLYNVSFTRFNKTAPNYSMYEKTEKVT